uniref:Rrf2 family transcriptional regulator n=1 Tax=Thermodesulfobacterium geofontis TaxID=1295609 RepID=A0A7V4JRD3_9BACT
MTRETDYAIRTVLCLSKKENYTSKAEEISKEMQIPKEFLMKILKQLEKAALLELKRGVSGGVKLVKKPKDITLYDVIVAMENVIALNRCVINKGICGLSSQCPVHPIWFKVRNKLIEALKEIKFSGLLTQGASS